MPEGTETRRGIATALVVMTFVLVLMGALVTSNEAGDSVPGWPLAWGTLVPGGTCQARSSSNIPTVLWPASWPP